MKKTGTLILLFLGGWSIAAQTQSDSLLIIQCGLNYMEGWYSADTARMNQALHVDLVKRRVLTDQENRVSEMNKASMLEKTSTHAIVPIEAQGIKITILDIYGTIASVKAESKGFHDYLHMVKIHGEWQIIHALWDKKKKSTQ